MKTAPAAFSRKELEAARLNIQSLFGQFAMMTRYEWDKLSVDRKEKAKRIWNVLRAAKLVLGLILFAAFSAQAQTVTYATLSGTITDTSSTPYSLGSVIIQFVPPTGQQCGLGNPPNFSFQKTYTIPLDATGAFSGISIPTNSSFNCSGSQWGFTTASQGGFGIATVKLTISGTTSLSSSLSNQVRISWSSGVIPPPGANGQVIASLGNGLSAWANSITGQPAILSGGGSGSFSGAPLLGSAPAMMVLDCTGCSASDTIGWIMRDSLVAGTTNPVGELVMKSNGQVESINLNASGYVNSQVGASGFGEYTSYNSMQFDTVHAANISFLPGSGAGGDGTGDVITKDLLTGPIKGNSTGATLTGTGVCLTLSGPLTAGPIGAVTCTGTGGAGTLIITPPSIATPSFFYICGGSDTGLVAGGGGPIAALAQNGINNTHCTLLINSSTTNDIITFWYFAL